MDDKIIDKIMNDENIYQINIEGHKIDYFYDGESMVIFGQKGLDDSGFKLTGKHTKQMRINSGIDK